jgi:hypothetical protein
MTISDWFNSLVNVVVGLFSGMAAYLLATLIGTGDWIFAMGIIVPFVGLFFFSEALARLIDWLFPSGIRPARIPTPRQRKPLARTLSLPAGFALGVLAAALELTQGILELL